MSRDYSTGLAERLAVISARAGSHSSAATLAGVSLSQFKRYLTGRNQPTFEAMVRLAAQSKVSLDWLATGEGQIDKAASTVILDEAILARILAGAEIAQARRDLQLSPTRRAAIVTTAYAMVMDEGGTDANHIERVVERLTSLASSQG